MKEFVCELCDSTQFTKSNGLFICSGCGTQYTLQEMRALSREVPDDAPHIQTATPQPTYTPPAPQPQPQPTYTPPAPQPTYTPPAPQPTYTPPAPQPTYTPPAPQPQPQPTYTPPTPQPQPQATAPWKCVCGTVNNGFFCVKCGRPHSPETTVPPTAKKEEKPKKKKGKITFGKILAFILCGLSGFLFVVSLINALSPDSTDGNWMLLYTGIGELIVAFIAYKIAIHMERYNCPACGGKREHHREFLRTTTKVQNSPSQDGGTNTTETYTHHYRDTYVCPACGETRVEQVTGSGGSFTDFASGRVTDRTIPPKEF